MTRHLIYSLVLAFLHSIYRLDITPPDSNLVSGSFASLEENVLPDLLSRDILVSPVRLISIVTPMQEAGPGYLDRVRSNKFRAFTVGDKVNKRGLCVRNPRGRWWIALVPREFRLNTGFDFLPPRGGKITAKRIALATRLNFFSSIVHLCNKIVISLAILTVFFNIYRYM